MTVMLNVVIAVAGVFTIDFYLDAIGDNHIVVTRTDLYLSDYSVNLVAGGDNAVVTAYNVNDSLTKTTNSNEEIAIVTIVGSTITITPVASGNTSVTIRDKTGTERTITIVVAGTKTVSVSLGKWEEADAKIYAWVWGEGVTNQWIEVDLEHHTLTVPEGVTGFKLVRYNPSDVTLSNKYAFEGLTGDKWAESGDLTYTAGKTLTKVGWDDPFTWE